MVRVDAVLNSWKTVRADAAQAVEEFPATDFDFKPVGEVMTFREIATHILVAGHALTGMLLDGVENLTPAVLRERLGGYTSELPAHDTPRGLAEALRSSVETRCSQLAAQSPEFFSGLIRRFDGEEVTRLEMLQFVKEHELTHRAQAFLYLRLKGLVPATTRRRLAKAKA